MKQTLKPEYISFGIIGGTGFVIDSGIFTLLHHDVNYAVARTISILIAMTCCWLANRTFTFKASQKICFKEWLKYATTNSFGALINLGIFLSLCHASVFLKDYYLIPLMMATSVSMVSNFTLAKYYVFR